MEFESYTKLDTAWADGNLAYHQAVGLDDVTARSKLIEPSFTSRWDSLLVVALVIHCVCGTQVLLAFSSINSGLRSFLRSSQASQKRMFSSEYSHRRNVRKTTRPSEKGNLERLQCVCVITLCVNTRISQRGKS